MVSNYFAINSGEEYFKHSAELKFGQRILLLIRDLLAIKFIYYYSRYRIKWFEKHFIGTIPLVGMIFISGSQSMLYRSAALRHPGTS